MHFVDSKEVLKDFLLQSSSIVCYCLFMVGEVVTAERPGIKQLQSSGLHAVGKWKYVCRSPILKHWPHLCMYL